MKDWTGNKRTLGALLGASNHTSEDRQREDYYATDPDMVRDLLNAGAPLRQRVWEPACGAGHIVNVLRERGHEVYATDIVDRGCPDSCLQDFLWEFDGAPMGDVDIMTNPPYATAREFVERALQVVKPGANVWMLLKLSFLEGQSRKRLFNDTPPADVWVFSERRICAKNGDFSRYKAGAMAYAWHLTYAEIELVKPIEENRPFEIHAADAIYKMLNGRKIMERPFIGAKGNPDFDSPAIQIKFIPGYGFQRKLANQRDSWDLYSLNKNDMEAKWREAEERE